MPILRLAYTTLFLIAVLVVFELWGQVGGQSHLDLMPWYIKLLLGGGTAFALVKATAAAVANEHVWNGRTVKWAGILLALLVGCGLASYYEHVYGEEEEDQEQGVSGKVGFKARGILFTIVPVLFWTSCSSLPDSYPPPPQRPPLVVSSSAGLNYFLNMSNPNANAYIIQGIEGATHGTGFRWAFDHPVVRFFVPRMEHPKFTMEFALPMRIFRQTGPVTLTLRINGKLLDRRRYTEGGQLEYEHEVPPELLNWNAINLVAIEPDKVWTSEDGEKLGFVVSRLGFLE